jgi:hypothetical protein
MAESFSPSGIHHGVVQWEIEIDTESEIASVRQRVKELAKEHGFDQFGGVDDGGL